MRLRHELLNSENPELNTDRRELLSRLEALGFSNDVTAALEEVDREIRSAATAFDFNHCMDLLRTVFEAIFSQSVDHC